MYVLSPMYEHIYAYILFIYTDISIQLYTKAMLVLDPRLKRSVFPFFSLKNVTYSKKISSLLCTPQASAFSYQEF